MAHPSPRRFGVDAAAQVLTLAAFTLALAIATEASAQLPLPVEETGTTISLGNALVYTVDLGTIPERPELHVEVVATNPQGILQIEVSGWTGLGPCASGGMTWDASTPPFISSGVAATSLVVSLWGCEPRIATGFWDDGTVDVTIRYFGNFPFNAVDVDIRGATVIPTGEVLDVVDTSGAPQTAEIVADRDTVIYAANTGASNGQGYFLWAGHDYRLVGLPPPIPVRYRLNSLLAFDDLLATIPPGSVVTDAALELRATSIRGGGGTIDLHDLMPSASGQKWAEGNTTEGGDEFSGVVASPPAADWNDRRGNSDPWTTSGGDLISPALASQSVTTTGPVSFSTGALEASIQNAVDSRESHEGFLLRGPGTGVVAADIAAQFASSRTANASERPTLVVDYTPPANAGGTLYTGTVIYIGEGENFRWIYDTDGDDLLYTAIGGICEALDQDSPNGTENDYNYSYQGAPGYVGTDCCAWQIDAPQTGVVGTGQAIFFHNLDPSNPANLPPDTDGDGMRDGCDNCVGVPNGPYLGTCVGLSGPGTLCTADTDCGQYEFCSQSQDDIDLDEIGDACSVPEPGFAAMLGVSAAWLSGLARRRRAVVDRTRAATR